MDNYSAGDDFTVSEVVCEILTNQTVLHLVVAGNDHLVVLNYLCILSRDFSVGELSEHKGREKLFAGDNNCDYRPH